MSQLQFTLPLSSILQYITNICCLSYYCGYSDQTVYSSNMQRCLVLILFVDISLSVYIYIYTHIYIYIHTHIYIHINRYINIYIYIALKLRDSQVQYPLISYVWYTCTSVDCRLCRFDTHVCQGIYIDSAQTCHILDTGRCALNWSDTIHVNTLRCHVFVMFGLLQIELVLRWCGNIKSLRYDVSNMIWQFPFTQNTISVYVDVIGNGSIGFKHLM